MKIPIFAHLQAVSHLLPAYAGLRQWQKLQKPMRVFAVFAVFGVIIEIIEFTLGRFGIHNIFFINFYWLVQFECFTYLYHQSVEKPQHKNILQILGWLYLLVWAFDVSFDPFPKAFSEVIMAGGNILLLIISVFMLYNIFGKTEKTITQYSIFWISIGVIIYCSGTIIVFSMSNKILAMGMNYFIMLWHINWTLTIVANLFFTRSFWCKTF